jgi:glycosyltransferase involved in cell wall biosynthesis
MVLGVASQRCGVRDYAAALCAAMPAGSVRLVAVPMPPDHVFRHQVRMLWRARRAARQAGRELSSPLMHAQYSDFSWNGVRPFEDLYEVLTRHCRVPMVVTLHEHPWFRGDHGGDRPRTVADRAFGCLAADPQAVLRRHRGIHIHHRWQADTLSRGGIPRERLYVVPYPVPPPQPCGDGEAFRNRFALAGKRVLAMTGFIFERKRADRALAVLPLLPSDVVLCCLGGAQGVPSESHLESLRQQARQLGVADRFVVTGYLPVTDLATGLDVAEVVLAPYQEVTSSASVADAIGRGIPILASDVASFRELEEDGAGVECADVTSSQAFLEAIRRVLDDPGHAADLRARNQAYAERHSVARFAAKMIEWYGEVGNQ